VFPSPQVGLDDLDQLSHPTASSASQLDNNSSARASTR
jgi:hypothetical protein